MNDLLPNMMAANNNNNNNINNENSSAGGGRNQLKNHRIAGSTSNLDPTLHGLSNIETMQFEIQQFASLHYKPGEYFVTQPISCHGHKWQLKIYPLGEDAYSNAGDCYVSCFLMCCDASSPTNLVTATWTFRIDRHHTFNNIRSDDDDDDEEENYSCIEEEYLYTFDGSDDDVCGSEEFVKRSEAISEYLDQQGSLVIDVDVQVYGKRKTWYPQHSKHQSIPSPPPGIHYFESSIGTDISFLVGGGINGRNDAVETDEEHSHIGNDGHNAAPESHQQQKFDVHKCILYHRAPGLYEFVKDATTKFELPDMSSPVFQVLLDYIYAGTVPKLGHMDHDDNHAVFAKELLLVSDRFDMTLLKLHVESEIVANFLQPASIVKSSKGWKSVKGSSDLLEELLEYHATRNQRIPNSCVDFDNMNVRSLRDELESLNLDLDGTRQMLMQRLKDHQLALTTASTDHKDE